MIVRPFIFAQNADVITGDCYFYVTQIHVIAVYKSHNFVLFFEPKLEDHATYTWDHSTYTWECDLYLRFK